MGWKFFIGIIGLILFIVSMYYYFQNIFSYTAMFFLVFLTLVYLIICIIQITR